MKSFKSLALAFALVFVGLQASAKELSYNHRFIEMNDRMDSCGGSATLTFVGNEAVLQINALRCQFVRKDNGPIETRNEFRLHLNTHHVFRIGGGSFANGAQPRNVIEVSTITPQVPIPPPRPAPGGRPLPLPRAKYERKDIYGSGEEVVMNACGGTAYFHQTFWTDTPQIEFRGVTQCTYYVVLHAEQDSVVLDATQSRLVHDPRTNRWGNKFALPNRWGYNTVRLRLQSESGKHIEDIVVHFVQH